MSTTNHTFGGIVALALLAGCSPPQAADTPSEPHTPPLASRPMLDIHEPQAQLMPGVGAVYLKIANAGGETDRLIAVESTAASSAETHETVVEDGVMRMVARPEGFEIPAEGSIELTPGGKHIMLIEPQPSIPEGGTIALTLHFATSESITIEAAVTTPAGNHGLEHGEAHSMAHTESQPGTNDH